MATETKPPEVAPITYIKCQCGNNIFTKGMLLAPGKEKPVILQTIWVCVGCGLKFKPEDFPKKGEEETRHESKLILPEGPGKLKLIQ